MRKENEYFSEIDSELNSKNESSNFDFSFTSREPLKTSRKAKEIQFKALTRKQADIFYVNQN